MTSEDDDHQRKWDEHEPEANEEHRIALERVASHMRERTGETSSVTTDGSPSAPRAVARQRWAQEDRNIFKSLMDWDIHQLGIHPNAYPYVQSFQHSF